MGSKDVEQKMLPAKTRLIKLKQLIRYESMRNFRERIRDKTDLEVQVEMKNALVNVFLAEYSARNMLLDKEGGKMKFNRFVDSSLKTPFFLKCLDEIDTVKNDVKIKLLNLRIEGPPAAADRSRRRG